MLFRSVTQEAVRDFVPRALELRIDLGYEGAEPGGAAMMQGYPVLVGELVRNLVDNALRYTQRAARSPRASCAIPLARCWCCRWKTRGPGSHPLSVNACLSPFIGPWARV